MSIQSTIEEVRALDEFSFVTPPPVAQPVKKEEGEDQDFSTESKSYGYVNLALPKAPRCNLCNARLHKNGISSDHGLNKIEGGTKAPENAHPTHPYCNTTYKRTLSAGLKP
jgi:hypothetical protein